jgi:hypothetical protein
VGRLALLVAVTGVAVAIAAAASATTGPRPIQFGRSGGNGPQWTVSVKSSGRVTIASSGGGTRHRKISTARVRRLGREIQRAHLAKQRICAASNPDFSSQYIRFAGHRFSLRGSCEPRFQRVWNHLAAVAGRLPR